MPLEFIRTIAQTPAPTFAESRRAGLIQRLWQDAGFVCQQDSIGNVITRISPQGTENKKALVLMAHLDTVFPIETDVGVLEQGGRLIGAGVGDNSASLAVVTAFLRDLDTAKLRRPLWVVANVGEEGLGDLAGAKHFLQENIAGMDSLLVIDGYLGVAATKAVGVRRYRATFSGLGGHSWGDNSPSAIHALAKAIAGLYALPLPNSPRTTLNVGVVSGGNSVNSIAKEASLLLDLRSIDVETLADLDRRSMDIMSKVARETGVRVSISQVGNRAGGDLKSGKLLEVASKVAKEHHMELRQVSSSTDANAAIPHGVPSITFGVYVGGNAHRTDEWVQARSLKQGMRFLQDVVSRCQ